MQTAVGTTAELASRPTHSRLETRVETRATRGDMVALNRLLVAQFIASHRVAPKELILDIDASDIPLHGEQEQAEFHAYYDHYCYLPLYVFAGQAMLACVLRRSRIDDAKQVAAVIKLLATRLREAWPAVRIIVRGDFGFCRQRLIRWYLAGATAATIRVKLLMIGAAVIRNTRRVRILFASHHPMHDTFLTAAQALTT